MSGKKYVREGGGMVRRVMHAIEAFHCTYGNWPTKLRLGANSLGFLVTHNLTPQGFFLLQTKLEVELSEQDALDIVAADDSDHAFDYVRDSADVPDGSPRATEWLGFGDETV